jgi:hypothetical protein
VRRALLRCRIRRWSNGEVPNNAVPDDAVPNDAVPDNAVSDVSCQLCHRRSEATGDGSFVLSWAMDVMTGEVRWTCPDCSRLNVRAIEAKLEPQWW